MLHIVLADTLLSTSNTMWGGLSTAWERANELAVSAKEKMAEATAQDLWASAAARASGSARCAVESDTREERRRWSVVYCEHGAPTS